MQSKNFFELNFCVMLRSNNKNSHLMRQEDILKEKYGTDAGFRVPDGYFDNLNSAIMSKLPDYPEVERVAPLSVWQRVKPYVYLAAMFAGIWCTMKMVTMIQSAPAGTEVSLDNPPAMIAQAMSSFSRGGYTLGRFFVGYNSRRQ